METDAPPLRSVETWRGARRVIDDVTTAPIGIRTSSPARRATLRDVVDRHTG